MVNTCNKLLLLNILLVFQCCYTVSGNLEPICCVPDQYETFIYGFTGVVDVLEPGNLGYGFGITNGTMRVVYDGVTERAYYFEETFNLLSIYPIPIVMNYTGIYDYKNNVQYRVYYDGTCDKYEVGYPLYKECIPGNATLLGQGMLGGQMVSHYMFYDRIYGGPNQVTLSVVHSDTVPGECTPVRVTQSDSYVFDSNKNVDLSGGDVVSFKKGAVDPSVFVPPPACPKDFSKLPDDFHLTYPSFGLWKRSFRIK